MRYKLRTLLLVVAILAVLIRLVDLAARYAGSLSAPVGRPIKIILPVGYEGEVVIVKDRANGQPLVIERGEWVFRIPPEGVLVVNDDQPFCVWHKETHVFSDGQPAVLIPVPGASYNGTGMRWKVIASPGKRPAKANQSM